MHPTPVIKLVQECGWHITLHAEPNTSTDCQRGDPLESVARQWLDWCSLLYFTMQYAPTSLFMATLIFQQHKGNTHSINKRPNPFALSETLPPRWNGQRASQLAVSLLRTQATHCPSLHNCTLTHIHRPHVGLRLEFTHSHSVEMATLCSKPHSDAPALFPLKIPDLQEDASPSPSYRLPHTTSTAAQS